MTLAAVRIIPTIEKKNTMMLSRFIACSITVLICTCGGGESAANPEPPPASVITIEKTWEIAAVPSAFPVGFSLLTKANRQFVAYFDAQHRMTVAARTLDSDQWQYQVLPSQIGWDSHNYITMALDSEGYLHLSGNMHCVPLIYFRTAKPWDITTLERIPSMTGSNEKRCTYPHFMEGPDRQLIFHYRDGSSGNGSEIYNVYDNQSKTWRRLLDKPLIDGEGKMNAYMSGPEKGPDGWFYLAWVWRDTPACETNHDPSCARSRDLVNWETLTGTPITLPITIATPGTLIDPVPAGGGILNGALRIGFDSTGRPLASYYKFDTNGITQAYAARLEAGQWRPRQISSWNYRWEFKGGGSIRGEIGLGSIEPHAPGQLALAYSHSKEGSGLLIFDEKSLTPLGKKPQTPKYPKAMGRVESAFPEMRVKTAGDSGAADEPGVRYALRWETLPANRDRKPPEPHPEPSQLRLYKLKP